ncbi:OmpA3 [Desulforapulum autotrophicum HRM2]|uniref:OmpA3 n=1 Tax=Desulforapulum autotrophicum (strain ATCC 43914 / DSM 3382 / VKM B-1955 / HRM2) TaxID=177437 RepID=C0QGC5_DESAH|nr:OmpA family protein [Desulforapulum autotrophicum]ACN17704.1 OmpA3 [Desulforapulum autotrophicum HRM2]
MVRYSVLFFCLFFVCACGSKTTVILLPQADGKTGSVVVKSRSDSIVLDKPYTYTMVSNDRLDTSENSIAKERVASEYQNLLASEPVAPVSFIFYFNTGDTSLTKESLDLIPEVLNSVKERAPSEISIIGHTDTKGASVYNNKLSLERANKVAKIITHIDANLKNIYIQFHGENDPLVITGDNVSEKRNRRVEIMVR